MESGRITDDQISASSVYDSNYGPTRARLNQPSDPPFSGAWSAGRGSPPNSWIQVSFLKETLVTAVITQGRPDYEQWVKRYSVEYTQDGLSWDYIDDDDASTPKVSMLLFVH